MKYCKFNIEELALLYNVMSRAVLSVDSTREDSLLYSLLLTKFNQFLFLLYFLLLLLLKKAIIVKVFMYYMFCITGLQIHMLSNNFIPNTNFSASYVYF